MNAKERILLVGPLPREGTPIGGTQVSFGELVRRVRASDRLNCEVVDTSRPVIGRTGWSRAPQDARTLTATLHAIAKIGPRCDAILFNASSGGVMKAGPFVWAAARAVRRPFGLRVFGGDLDLRFAREPAWRRATAERTCLSAPLVLLQTQHLCRSFERLQGAHWLPTTRDLVASNVERTGPARRFLFLSQLKREKGVREALTASDALAPDSTLTFHGPTIPGTDLSGDHARVRFAGPVRPEELSSVLARHDALVFPTWYEGEGMPGAVIEAMQAGLPVIGSRWRSLPELVEDGVNGLLVPPRDVEALGAAMHRLESDPHLFRTLSRGAAETGDRFRGGPWHAELEQRLIDLCRGDRASAPLAEAAA